MYIERNVVGCGCSLTSTLWTATDQLTEPEWTSEPATIVVNEKPISSPTINLRAVAS